MIVIRAALGAIVIAAIPSRYGGSYADPVIANDFEVWLSPNYIPTHTIRLKDEVITQLCFIFKLKPWAAFLTSQDSSVTLHPKGTSQRREAPFSLFFTGQPFCLVRTRKAPNQR